VTAAAAELGTLITGGTIAGAHVVACARRFLGTPFVHQGRLGGVGLDCIGLLQAVAQGCGIAHEDFAEYSRRPDGEDLERRIAKHCRRVQLAEARPGDILVFWIKEKLRGRVRPPHHVGIRTDVGIIHTHGLTGVRRVVEHSLDTFWTERILSAWRLRAIA
jgi:cell wall-associated NlpC family hydrolase